MCYKSEGHANCSEQFYKECVEDELKLDQLDPESKNKMVDILKRFQNQDLDDFYPENGIKLLSCSRHTLFLSRYILIGNVFQILMMIPFLI